ncbi:MAG: alpha/beta fold hydrolase [Alphaproteobacteria bacterium]|nr:alpha/beta fold hydrolase [Alphaproteobacteria bacterium]
MSLSVSQAFREESCSVATDMGGFDRSDAPMAPCRDVEVSLPLPLHRFGRTTSARISGRRSGPVVVVLGGISGTRFVCSRPDGEPGWWPGLVGRGCAIDPAHHCILGLDFAADESGEAAPTTADQAEVLRVALDAIGCARAEAIIGASYGGMVGLAFAQLHPERVNRIVVISAGAEPHAAASAARELQRRVVALGLDSGRRDEALSIARGLAMLTYRTAEEFSDRFAGGLAGEDPLGATEPGQYLRARGDAFRAVMSPERFLSLSASIDRHRIDPTAIRTPTLIIGAESDLLVPAEQLRALAASLGGETELHLRPSLYGHDMFLKEASEIGRLVERFITR